MIESLSIFMSSALLVIPMFDNEVAQKVWGTSDNSRVSKDDSSSVLSIINYRAYNNSDSDWSGNSRGISLLVVKFVPS